MLKEPQNPNYAATVVSVDRLEKLPNRDRIVAFNALGFQTLVGVDTHIGTVGVMFPPECQLNAEYCGVNNLFEDHYKFLNSDPEAKGYLGNTRRIKALTLGGHRSDSLFMPLSSLMLVKGVTGKTVSSLKVGDIFDELDGVEICRKYVKPVKGQGGIAAMVLPSRVDMSRFQEQFNIPNYFANAEQVDPFASVIVTQKLHGANIRIGNTYGQRKLSFVERLAKRFGAKVQETEFVQVYGSHHVIKDANNPGSKGYYGTDIWTQAGKELDGKLPPGMVAYGEIIGFTPTGRAIQPGYTYNCAPQQMDLYIYRLTVVLANGQSVDLSWDQVVRFCTDLGVKHVPVIWKGSFCDFNAESFIDQKFAETIPGTVPLSTDSPCDEGVVVRIDKGFTHPQLLKAKSHAFRRHETKLLDDPEAEDIDA